MKRLTLKRTRVRFPPPAAIIEMIPTLETIFDALLIWIKAWINKFVDSSVANPANGRVDIDEWLAYKIQFCGLE